MFREMPELVHYEERNATTIYDLPLDIPKYQRIYTWQKEQVKTLLDDICGIKGDLGKYYIGAIILHRHTTKDGEICDIVDGQQRVVTTSLIKYALFGERLNENEKKFLNWKFASIEAHKNLKTNYDFIIKYLSIKDNREKIQKNLPKLCLGVIIIDNTENLDLAFTFFANTNSRGKKLTEYDLLKPHHLRYIPSDLEEQQLHLATKWDNMINATRSVEMDMPENRDKKEYIPYIRMMEIMLFRLRNWNQMISAPYWIDHPIKKEFEAAPIIDEIPPFGERFFYGEPIQGGQHFFAYVDHFLDEYKGFCLKDENGDYGMAGIIQDYFGQYGSSSWYGSVIEALTFCYFLKFGNSYIYEATMSIVRYVSIIRFRIARAYKPTIWEWARRSHIAVEIGKATSPTFFLAALENLIDNAPNDDGKVEDASSGIRKAFLNSCERITGLLISKTTTNYYKDYYSNRYGKFD